MIQKPDNHGGLIDKLLEAQQQTTAVEKFSQQFTALHKPAMEEIYRDLIPLTTLEEGQQYSFEVDMDACSGCKACVTACHSLNGLEEGEVWRNVGLLVGGEEEKPAIQHVTSACHHCVEPACMLGCPVNAYEKDAVTGIVEHLDDQCIGCKYCMFTCPYDVPSYSQTKGIVRKCNMCKDRLGAGEAPACVQACPNQAIKIVAVNKEEIKSKALARTGLENQLVAGAPDSSITSPTTRYAGANSSAALLDSAAVLLPKDYAVVRSLHSHWPLVFMLVLTQLSVGMIAATCFAEFQILDAPDAASLFDNLFGNLYLLSFAVLNIGLFAAIFHLGRPQFAYRAMAGFRTSWLSREIIAFNALAGAAGSVVALSTFPILGDWFSVPRAWVALSASLAGVVAIATSVMVYAATKRPLWTMARTGGLFYLSAAVTGTMGVVAAAAMITRLTGDTVLLPTGTLVVLLLSAVIFSISKMAVHWQLTTCGNTKTFSPRKHAALLLAGEMKLQSITQMILLGVGGVVLPLLLLVILSGGGGDSVFFAVFAFLGAVAVVIGELFERYLFFAVAVARRMPGAPNH